MLKKPAPGGVGVASVVLVAVMLLAGGCSVRRLPQRQPLHTALTLDGVTVEVATAFLSDARFQTPERDSAIQVATAVEREPVFREFSMTAVPFGTSPPTESLPPAGPGGAGAYRGALRAHRREQGGDPRTGPVINLFGEAITGTQSVVALHVRGPEAVPVSVTEWVVEAGSRLWIVRAARELQLPLVSRLLHGSEDSSFSDTVVRSADLTRPSTSVKGLEEVEPLESGHTEAPDQVGDLPFPIWWEGDCDAIGFEHATGTAAYPLGAEYRGIKACGPRPFADGGPWRWVNFGDGYSQIEWQCPEISKRFLYLAYGIPPYLGNGNQVVTNYQGDLLEKVWNCTPGRAPEPDDVLSYGATSTYGHTALVAAANVDGAGHGTVQVIEQNSSRSGFSTLAVRDWCVVAYTDVIGWLHHPGWLVEHYRDDAMTDRCATHLRAGTYLFESGLTSHGGGNGTAVDACPADGLRARFSRSVHFPGGVYTFGLGYEGDARLRIDGETVVDGWGGAKQHYQADELEVGHHHVVVEVLHDGDAAPLTAVWWGPGFEMRRETQEPGSWYAEYWGNQDLWWDPVVAVREGEGHLENYWFGGAPADGLPADHFSSRFQRTVLLDGGQWRFSLFADDGVRMWIDDQLIVDEWQDQVTEFAPVVSLGSGDHVLRVEHYENLGYAKVGLEWQHVSEDVVPAGRVTQPPSGSVIEACPILLEAQVDDRIDAVDRVEFHAYFDGEWRHLGDDSAPPYELLWDCERVSNQTAWLTTHVWDDAGTEFVGLDAPIQVILNHLESLYLPFIRAAGAVGR